MLEQKNGVVGDVDFFSFSCFDQNKNFVAGIRGMNSWGGFDSLFVNQNIRNQNYGTLLI
ncbi:peptidyl-tRNA hydrolase [Rickettsia canadensis str. McKiel]|uniref:Peptidyl-tRNA hydrolase n=1 Tax=Rickettsia canadensis (strain McKiel) TaxID=293613 RepID=A8EY66_RICCK|nr:hypothetical protein [Rickettsia canadensis]ABV73299.1 peptidyl-tRNA hydrolase [Rickettsia canadensis str. McKiel]